MGGKRTKGGPGPAAFPAGLLRAFMSCSTPGRPRERPHCTGVPKPTCPQNPCCRNVSQKRAPRLPQETRSEMGGPRPGWSSHSDTGLPWDPMESVQGHTGPLIPGRLGRKGPGVPRGNRAPCLGPRNHGSRRRTLVGERWPEPPPPAGVDGSPLPYDLHREDSWGVILASQNSQGLSLPPLPKATVRSARGSLRRCGGQRHARGSRRERGLEAVTPHFKGPPIN